MLEGFILTVDVGEEVLRALRQVHDRLQVDDLRTCVGNRRKLAGKYFEVPAVRFEVVNCFFRFHF